LFGVVQRVGMFGRGRVVRGFVGVAGALVAAVRGRRVGHVFGHEYAPVDFGDLDKPKLHFVVLISRGVVFEVSRELDVHFDDVSDQGLQGADDTIFVQVQGAVGKRPGPVGVAASNSDPTRFRARRQVRKSLTKSRRGRLGIFRSFSGGATRLILLLRIVSSKG